MAQVKEYCGVIIYVNPDGQFYCDPVNNSDNFKNKLFVSDKISSIEKAINNFEGSKKEDIEEFYHINYDGTIKKLKVISQVGTRKFFDDGTDTTHMSRTKLHPKTIETSDYFPKLLELGKENEELNEKVMGIYKEQAKVREKISEILNTFKIVKP